MGRTGAGLIVLTLIGFSITTASGQLKWEFQTVEMRATPSDEALTAHFKFRNEGERTVHIVDVSAACSCTTAVADRMSYPPGENGEIVVTFRIGDLVGVFEKAITVATDDPRNAVTVLRFVATIPAVLEITPQQLNWLPEEPLRPKSVNIKVQNDYPVHDLQIRSSNAGIETELEVISQRDYRLIVTPTVENGTAAGLVYIKTDYPAKNPKNFVVKVHAH